MKHYCYTCLMTYQGANEISAVEAQETMSEFHIPLCASHAEATKQERRAKREIKRQKRLHDALEDYPEIRDVWERSL